MKIDVKILNISEPNPRTHKKRHTLQSSGIHPKFTKMVQHMQINMVYHIQKRPKPHDYLDRCRKTFNRSQHSSIIKTLTKVGIEGTYLKLVKTVYGKHTDNKILNGEK